MCMRCKDPDYDCGYNDPLYTRVSIERGKDTFGIWVDYKEKGKLVTKNIATCKTLESILAVLKGIENRLAVKV